MLGWLQAQGEEAHRDRCISGGLLGPFTHMDGQVARQRLFLEQRPEPSYFRFTDRAILRQHHAVRVADLQGLLLRHAPDILHFSGHGRAAGEIVLEDSSGRIHPVTSQALGSVFAALADPIRCVVLNACFSQTQAEAIAQHVDAVVGMAITIGDRAATSFATAFYQAVAYGESVRTAFELGTAQIGLENLGEAEIPQLIALHTDPTQIDFIRNESPNT